MKILFLYLLCTSCMCSGAASSSSSAAAAGGKALSSRSPLVSASSRFGRQQQAFSAAGGGASSSGGGVPTATSPRSFELLVDPVRATPDYIALQVLALAPNQPTVAVAPRLQRAIERREEAEAEDVRTRNRGMLLNALTGPEFEDMLEVAKPIAQDFVSALTEADDQVNELTEQNGDLEAQRVNAVNETNRIRAKSRWEKVLYAGVTGIFSAAVAFGLTIGLQAASAALTG